MICQRRHPSKPSACVGANSFPTRSFHDPNFLYKLGETVEISNFDYNPAHECAPGIHFFFTAEQALQYHTTTPKRLVNEEAFLNAGMGDNYITHQVFDILLNAVITVSAGAPGVLQYSSGR